MENFELTLEGATKVQEVIIKVHAHNNNEITGGVTVPRIIELASTYSAEFDLSLVEYAHLMFILGSTGSKEPQE